VRKARRRARRARLARGPDRASMIKRLALALALLASLAARTRQSRRPHGRRSTAPAQRASACDRRPRRLPVPGVRAMGHRPAPPPARAARRNPRLSVGTESTRPGSWSTALPDPARMVQGGPRTRSAARRSPPRAPSPTARPVSDSQCWEVQVLGTTEPWDKDEGRGEGDRAAASISRLGAQSDGAIHRVRAGGCLTSDGATELANRIKGEGYPERSATRGSRDAAGRRPVRGRGPRRLLAARGDAARVGAAPRRPHAGRQAARALSQRAVRVRRGGTRCSRPLARTRGRSLACATSRSRATCSG
jgi:hypothetical protein